MVIIIMAVVCAKGINPYGVGIYFVFGNKPYGPEAFLGNFPKEKANFHFAEDLRSLAQREHYGAPGGVLYAALLG